MSRIALSESFVSALESEVKGMEINSEVTAEKVKIAPSYCE
ncbi:MAG: hypothetical protein ACLRHZ_06925 [Enterococcus avium]